MAGACEAVRFVGFIIMERLFSGGKTAWVFPHGYLAWVGFREAGSGKRGCGTDGKNGNYGWGEKEIAGRLGRPAGVFGEGVQFGLVDGEGGDGDG
jgi:hypothetical protein